MKDKIISQFDKDVKRIKDKLIKKVAKKGIYENFGDTEIRILEDKYHQHYNYGFYERSLKLHNKMMNFKNWCYNYNGGGY